MRTCSSRHGDARLAMALLVRYEQGRSTMAAKMSKKKTGGTASARHGSTLM
jgi:hypothetical protein